MKKIRESLFFGACILLVGGMLILDFARAIPSIAMIILVLLGISYWIKPEPGKNHLDSKVFLALMFSFILLFPSWFYSDNKNYLFEKWQIALPYLLLPFAFIVIPKLPEKKYQYIYIIYLLGIFLISLFAFINYLFNQESVNQLYLESRVMPTILSHHPTLSLMIVYAIYIAYWMYQKQSELNKNYLQYFYLFAGIFLFVFIHVFSVRSGLLALYFVFFIELGKLIFAKKQFKNAFYAAIFFLLIGGITLFLSPTFSNKITNTTQDLGNYKNNGSGNNQSLTSRFISYQNAFRIAKESNYFFGCGLGDIQDLNTQIFKTDYPDVSKPIIPHNQFLFYLAAIGIIGLSLFIFSFYFPLFYKQGYKNSLLFIHYLIISIGFQFEAPLETQVGVAYSLIFILLPLHQMYGSSIGILNPEKI